MKDGQMNAMGSFVVLNTSRCESTLQETVPEADGQGYVLLVDVELTLSHVLTAAFQYGKLYLSLVALQIRSRCQQKASVLHI
jgi:hypothetical protein